MGKLVIECPNTGKEVNTGFAIDKESLKSATLKNNSVKCPHCGEIHTWDKEDASIKN